jgi:hypothetical protein
MVEVSEQRLLQLRVDEGGDLLALLGEELHHGALRRLIATAEEGDDVLLEQLVVVGGEALELGGVHCRTGGRLGASACAAGASGRVQVVGACGEAWEFGAGHTQVLAVREGDDRLQRVEVALRIARALQEQREAAPGKEPCELARAAPRACQLLDVVDIERIELEAPLAALHALARACRGRGRAGALVAGATVSVSLARRLLGLDAQRRDLALQSADLLALLVHRLERAGHALLDGLRHCREELGVGERHRRDDHGERRGREVYSMFALGTCITAACFTALQRSPVTSARRRELKTRSQGCFWNFK